MIEQHHRVEADDPILDAYFAELLDEESVQSQENTDSTGSEMEEPSQPEQAHEGESRYWLFPVAGLRLAVPEDRVFSHVPAPTADITWRDGSCSCFEATVDDRRLLVFDSLGLMDPDHRQGDGVGLPASVRFLVRLDTGDLALTAEAEPVLEGVDRDAVCWRGATGRRAWLAGTLSSRNCVIVDVDGLYSLAGR